MADGSGNRGFAPGPPPPPLRAPAQTPKQQLPIPAPPAGPPPEHPRLPFKIPPSVPPAHLAKGPPQAPDPPKARPDKPYSQMKWYEKRALVKRSGHRLHNEESVDKRFAKRAQEREAKARAQLLVVLSTLPYLTRHLKKGLTRG